VRRGVAETAQTAPTPARAIFVHFSPFSPFYRVAAKMVALMAQDFGPRKPESPHPEETLAALAPQDEVILVRPSWTLL
jgi:hypothetical protein